MNDKEEKFILECYLNFDYIIYRMDCFKHVESLFGVISERDSDNKFLKHYIGMYAYSQLIDLRKILSKQNKMVLISKKDPKKDTEVGILNKLLTGNILRSNELNNTQILWLEQFMKLTNKWLAHIEYSYDYYSSNESPSFDEMHKLIAYIRSLLESLISLRLLSKEQIKCIKDARKIKKDLYNIEIFKKDILIFIKSIDRTLNVDN